MLGKIFKLLLILTPITVVGHYLKWSPILIFFIAALAIVPLAKYLGEATEELASHSGPALGGLLNVTFGNATEVIIGIFALKEGLIEVVKASITGSIIGNLLLVLGMAFLVGGLRFNKQKFNRTAVSANSSVLFLAVIALVVPTALLRSTDISAETTQSLSTTIAIVMLVVYAANLLFMFRTHTHLFNQEAGKYESKWPVKTSLAVLLGSTVAIAWISEILVVSIKPTLVHLGWTELFVGTVIVAIIGNAAEHTSAILFAAKNRMDLSIQIAVGSASQIALFVVPVLVFASLLTSHHMNLVFNFFELITIVMAVMITNLIVSDGESNWLEGAQLLSAYAVIAVAFYLHP